jgi:hypothetical protein
MGVTDGPFMQDSDGRRISRRRLAALLTTGAAALSLGAPVARGAGYQATPSPEDRETGPRLIEHAMGETEVPADPQRVVVLDTGELDAAMTLGIKPVGAVEAIPGEGFPSYLEGTDDIENVGTIAEPSLEKIAALNPDLILSSKLRHEAIYDQLSKIPPTVFAEKTGVAWKGNFDLFAEALGRTEEAEIVKARSTGRRLATSLSAPTAPWTPAAPSSGIRSTSSCEKRMPARPTERSGPGAAAMLAATALPRRCSTFRMDAPGHTSMTQCWRLSCDGAAPCRRCDGSIVDGLALPQPSSRPPSERSGNVRDGPGPNIAKRDGSWTPIGILYPARVENQNRHVRGECESSSRARTAGRQAPTRRQSCQATASRRSWPVLSTSLRTPDAIP